VSSSGGSEQGFYRVSGRKIQSVLESGGDGYGNNGENTMSVDGASFYRDSQGFYGGLGGSSSAGPHNSGIPNLRPSPARTPVIAQGISSDIHLDQPPQVADGVSRSLASRDGSHAGSHISTSRFTEDV